MNKDESKSSRLFFEKQRDTAGWPAHITKEHLGEIGEVAAMGQIVLTHVTAVLMPDVEAAASEEMYRHHKGDVVFGRNLLSIDLDRTGAACDRS